MKEWEDLVSTALLGTAKRDMPDGMTMASRPLAGVGVRHAEPAGRLLDQAAVLTTYRRAGRLPRTGLVVGEPAPPETKPRVSRAAARRLKLLLDERPGLLPEWLALCAEAGARVPQRPRHRDIDWDRTIRANLRHYQPDLNTVIPERLIGYGRRQQAVQRDVVLAIDQSGSMAASVVYASVLGAVLASMRSLKTSLVVFDTAVVDLTEQLDDPGDVLFGTQLGGGTDINRAIAYCQGLIGRPQDTVFVLISDLYEGGIRDEMLKRIATMTAAGVQAVVLLALSDEGAPCYDHDNATALAELGVPAFACTPDVFPDLMAAAIQRHDLRSWVEQHGTA